MKKPSPTSPKGAGLLIGSVILALGTLLMVSSTLAREPAQPGTQDRLRTQDQIQQNEQDPAQDRDRDRDQLQNRDPDQQQDRLRQQLRDRIALDASLTEQEREQMQQNLEHCLRLNLSDEELQGIFPHPDGGQQMSSQARLRL